MTRRKGREDEISVNFEMDNRPGIREDDEMWVRCLGLKYVAIPADEFSFELENSARERCGNAWARDS